MNKFTMQKIGTIRQDTDGFRVELEEQFLPALIGLEGFSHINLFWWFSECDDASSRSSLQEPSPYKGSPEILGTFATRSPMRPNPIALSCAEITYIDQEHGIIGIAYTDANDGSPVLDIKPYTPSLDRVETPQTPDWCAGWPGSLEASASFDWERVFQF